MTCVEKRGIFFWGVIVCSLGEESWDGEEEWETREERVGKVVIYSFLPMESPTDYFYRRFHQQFWWWIGHVIVRRSRFESLSNSFSKIARKNFHVSEPLFFLILNILSIISSIYTNRITNRILSVDNYHCNLST
jgi:hypothetical protein